MKIKALLKLAIIIVVGLISFGLIDNSSAMNKADMKAKAAYEGVYKCIEGKAYNQGEWMASDFNKDGKGFLNNNAAQLDLVKMPYGWSKASDNSINCRQIMLGFGNGISEEELGFIPTIARSDTNAGDVASYFKNLGYSDTPEGQVTSNDKMQTFSLIAPDCKTLENGLSKYTDKKIEITDFDGNMIATTDTIVFPSLVRKGNGGWFIDDTIASNQGINVPAPKSGGTYNYSVCGSHFSIQDASAGNNDGGVQYSISGDIGGGNTLLTSNDGGYLGVKKSLHLTVGSEDMVVNTAEVDIDGDVAEGFSDYKMEWQGKPMAMIEGINANNRMGYSLSSVGDNYDSLKFSDQEIYDLYTYYAKDVFGLSVVCEGEEGFEANQDKEKINWVKGKDCRYAKGDNAVSPKNVYGVDTTTKHFGVEISSPEDLVAGLEKLDLSSLTTLQSGDSRQSDDDGGVCYANSGALGWIICPIISGIAGVGENLWGQIEASLMQIDVGILYDNKGGLAEVWGIFRNIANIAFVMFFLVVIFSQLTGVGIDNYGIKKILPKLIIVAILINLSYLICALAVDLSNILGVGLNRIFTMMADGVEPVVENISKGQYLAVGALEVMGGVGGIVLFTFLNPLGAVSAGLAVLGVAITIVISMVFLYFVLVARYAGVIILIAVAPVAILCYMLPNTDKIWKRWLDLLKALLLVYPICGALVGAGKLAGNLLAKAGSEAGGNTGLIVAGMIVEVIPFFLIPMLLKHSLALAGNIGARISNMGRTAGRKASSTAQGAIRGSERFKDWSQYQKGQTDLRRSERIMNKLGRRTNLGVREQDRLRRAQDAVLAKRKEGMENERRTQGGYFQAMANKQDLASEAEAEAISRMTNPTVLAAERQSLADEARIRRDKSRATLMMSQYRGEGLEQLMDRFDASFESGNQDDVRALASVINQRHGSSGASSIASLLSRKSDIGNNVNYQSSMAALQQVMNDNSSFAGNMKSKTPDAFQMISDGGRRYVQDKDQDGNAIPGTGRMEYADMGWFTNNQKAATGAKDWATASAATLARSANAKNENDEYTLTDRALNELLTSNDPAITSGLRSEDNKLKILQAEAYNRQRRARNEVELSTDEAAAAYEAGVKQREVAERAAQEAARQAYQVVDVRRYRPKDANGGQTEHTVRVMGDGRMVDENDNPFTDVDLYDRSD